MPDLFSIVLEIQDGPIRTEEEIKDIQMWRKKWTFFAGDITMFVENPKNSTPLPSKTRISEIRKVTGDKINVKSIAFLYTKIFKWEIEI